MVQVMYEEASQVANEAVGSIRTVASFCAEKKVMKLYETKCGGPKKQGIWLGIKSGVGYGFSFFALYCINAMCFFIGALLIHSGKATFQELFNVSKRENISVCFWFWFMILTNYVVVGFLCTHGHRRSGVSDECYGA